jgi:hypothetical protein
VRTQKSALIAMTPMLRRTSNRIKRGLVRVYAAFMDSP